MKAHPAVSIEPVASFSSVDEASLVDAAMASVSFFAAAPVDKSSSAV